MCGESNVLKFYGDNVKVFLGYVPQTEPDRARQSQTKLGPSSEAAAEQSGDAATDRVTLPCDCEVARSTQLLGSSYSQKMHFERR